jgi:hypothetical protein
LPGGPSYKRRKTLNKKENIKQKNLEKAKKEINAKLCLFYLFFSFFLFISFYNSILRERPLSLRRA